MNQSPGAILKSLKDIEITKDSYGVQLVRFKQPTIVRYGKYATELTDAYKGSLWGSKRWIRKWGVSIYNPKNEPEYKTTFRERDGDDLFEFIITERKIFDSKNEMKKFMESHSVSPFVTLFLKLEKEEKENKKLKPKVQRDPSNLLEYEKTDEGLKVTGKGTFDARKLLKEIGLAWSGKAWEGSAEIKDIQKLAQQGFVVREKKA